MKLKLINLGFTEIEAEAYVFLTTQSPKTAKAIAEALNLCRSQICRILKRLQISGAIDVSSEYPRRFSAVIFEKVLELLVEAKREQHEALLGKTMRKADALHRNFTCNYWPQCVKELETLY
jgi:sugar-specific transcriptional regulator TrmB